MSYVREQHAVLGCSVSYLAPSLRRPAWKSHSVRGQAATLEPEDLADSVYCWSMHPDSIVVPPKTDNE